MPEQTAPAGSLTDAQIGQLQRRSIGVLSLGQVLGGLAFGATISLGAVLAAQISGDDALSGLATAFVTLGAAATAVPLAGFAVRRGRRLALAAGMMTALAGVGLVILAVALSSFALLLVSFALIGAGQAANLQSRFAAADLADDRTRGRDLSIVVWATTIGAVLGPNLVGPGTALGDALGMPPLTGPYLFTVVAQILAIALYLIALRPDPLLTAQKLTAAHSTRRARAIAKEDRPQAARYAIIAIAGAHGVMVAVMAMTPVHLLHHGAALTIIGLTISLHIAGMYALSPVFGILADRWGRIPTILLGQLLLAASLVTAAVWQDSNEGVTIALILLGLGWSAATVAGAALLTEMSSEQRRPKRQGRSDLVMNLVGATGAIVAGILLGGIGYGGLALVSLAVVVLVTALSPLGRGQRPARPAPELD